MKVVYKMKLIVSSVHCIFPIRVGQDCYTQYTSFVTFRFLLFVLLLLALLVLYPYLTIHMRELGINVEETAIMSAVTPVVSIVMPPLAGMLADKIGNFKVCINM